MLLIPFFRCSGFFRAGRLHLKLLRCQLLEDRVNLVLRQDERVDVEALILRFLDMFPRGYDGLADLRVGTRYILLRN